MKMLKYGFLIFALSFAVITGVLLLAREYREHRRGEYVREGKVVIEQEIHKWNICEESRPVEMELYLRNAGSRPVSGKMVIKGALGREGLEETFMTELIGCYGEERLLEDIRREIDKGDPGRLRAIYNYIERGKRLPQGKGYEPVPDAPAEKSYTFRFREFVSLGPGEVLRLRHEQPIPIGERGGVLSVRVEDIEP